jgi:hypothetical protein
MWWQPSGVQVQKHTFCIEDHPRNIQEKAFIPFPSLTRPGLEPTIYHTRGEPANHYATDVVWPSLQDKD